MTDAGMTGARDSVIGICKEIAIEKFLSQLPNRFDVAKKNPVINAALVDIDPHTGHANTIERILELVKRLLPKAASIGLEDLGDMAPSELRMIWEAFKEVNSDFLALVERLGIAKALGDLIRQHLIEALADLSSGDTPIPGSTAGASS